MSLIFCRCAGLLLSGLFVAHSALAIDVKGELSSTPAASRSLGSSVSSPSGTVTSIDAGNGVLVLDRTRRFFFTPGTVKVGNQNNRPQSGGLGQVKEGTRVNLTVISNSAYSQPRVTELWIFP